MKTEDFNRLKEICEKEGLHFDFDHISETAVVAKWKDPWDGVEFVECVNTLYPEKYWTKGRIYKVEGKALEKLTLINNVSERVKVVNYCSIGYPENNCFKPSTEQDYVDQLKKEAYDRFGEINHNNIDLFDNSNLDQMTMATKNEWVFDRQFDAFYYWGYCLYKQGKWATKLPERVKVEFSDDSWDDFDDYIEIGYVFKINKVQELRKVSGKFLAKQLENYLNDK